MRRFWPVLLLLGASLLLSACSRQSLLILTDQYWKAVALDRVGHAIAQVSSKTGVRIAITTIPYGSNALSEIDNSLAKSRADMVLLSPLYSSDGAALAARFPRKRIMAFAPPAPKKPVSGNLVELVSNPAPAFRSAALRAAEELAKRGGGRSGIVQIAAVFSDDSQGQAELAGFQSGLQSLAAPPAMETLVVSGTADRSRLLRFVQGSEAKGVSLYLLAAPSLNAYAFELLKDADTPVITENWDYGATYSGKVLFSIDEDIVAALLKTVETMGRPSDNEIRVPWDIVAAPSQSSQKSVLSAGEASSEPVAEGRVQV